MPAETIELPVSGGLAQLGAMGYLAILAYPKRTDIPRRRAFITAAKARLSKHTTESDRTRHNFLEVPKRCTIPLDLPLIFQPYICTCRVRCL